MPNYEIRGKGIKSGRSRKRIYYANGEAEAKFMAEKDGTVVEDLTKLPPPGPTCWQIECARELGIKPPENITSEEMTDLLNISRNKDKPATERHKDFARSYGITFSNYIGKKALFDRIYEELRKPGREKDMLSWFTFRVYRELMHSSVLREINQPDDQIIIEVVNELINQQSVIDSARRYSGRDLIWFGVFTGDNGFTYSGGSNRTIAYRKVASLLRERLGISIKQSTAHRGKAKGSGCLSAIAVAIVLPILFGFPD